MNNDDYLKTALVIGNGFDLDLGFKTRYCDFAHSEVWKIMYEDHVAKSKQYSLLKYLNDRRDIDKWFDIEQALLEYASSKVKDVWLHDVKTDKMEYEAVCAALGSYLKKHIAEQSHDISHKRAVELLRVFHSDRSVMQIYSFNFTQLEQISNVAGILHLKSPHYVHGNVKDDSHILGIDIKSFDKIIPEYSFLIKSNNSHYQSTSIASDLVNAHEVIIYGHSLNMIDSVYFDDYLIDLSATNERNRRLTIITKDEASQIETLDNIRKLGVSIPKLYSHGHLEFILTSKMDNGIESEIEKFEKLLERNK